MIATLLSAALLAAQPATTATLLGSWANEAGTVTVLISPCGENAVCGTVVSASDKAKADAKRGGTPNLIGTELLHGFTGSGSGRWKGSIFVPDIRRRSKAEIIQLDENRMRVRGCAVVRVLCKSQVWTRVAASQ
jgi:uncharacterized protein (DUF2147 family)